MHVVVSIWCCPVNMSDMLLHKEELKPECVVFLVNFFDWHNAVSQLSCC